MRVEARFRLPVRRPYDWPHALAFLSMRAVPGVERVDADRYCRVVRLGARPALVAVSFVETGDALELRVRGASPAARTRIRSTAARVFDVGTDPGRVRAAFGRDPLLGPLVRERPGLRVVGVWDPFECAVRAILGQQVSVAAGRTLLGRVVGRAARRLPVPMEGLTHAFPSPADIAAADLNGLGLTGGRIAALQNLARMVADRRLVLDGPVAEVTAAIAALPGCGPWTASYVALRGLGDVDAFPVSDLVLRRVAGGDAAPLSASALARLAEAWRPWRGHGAIHLWRAAADAPACDRRPEPAAMGRPA